MKKITRLKTKIIAMTMLKKDGRYAFGLPFHVHRAITQYSRKKLKEYKNVHEGKRVFIIGTGPSLTIGDVNKLKDEYTIGVNTLFNMFDKLGWQTNYYCLIDPKTYGNIKSDLHKKKVNNIFYAGNRILDKSAVGIPFELECSDFYKSKAPKAFEFTKFSPDLDRYIYDGASVVYAAIEIAVYMGFKEIYLLGVDCNYELKREELHNSALSYSKDYNYNWTKQTGLTMIEGFKVAKRYADEHGISIYNATRGGMLEVFTRVNLDEVLVRK